MLISAKKVAAVSHETLSNVSTIDLGGNCLWGQPAQRSLLSRRPFICIRPPKIGVDDSKTRRKSLLIENAFQTSKTMPTI